MPAIFCTLLIGKLLIDRFGLVFSEVQLELLERIAKGLERVRDCDVERFDGFLRGRNVGDQHVLLLTKNLVVHFASTTARLRNLDLVALKYLGCSGHGE